MRTHYVIAEIFKDDRENATTSQCSARASSGQSKLRRLSWDSCHLRDLMPKDLDDVKRLSAEAFPVKYTNRWYNDVVGGRYLSFGLIYKGELTSMIVASINKAKYFKDETNLCVDGNTMVVYILSLAVFKEYQRNGIASLLLKEMLDRVSIWQPKLVFLHVLYSNEVAIQFYERHGFTYHETLPKYYNINEGLEDGFTYLRHLNQRDFQKPSFEVPDKEESTEES